MSNIRRTMMAAGRGGDGWEEATLTYESGHSFTLMGVTFTYDNTLRVYTGTSVIYPSSIEFTLMRKATVTGANVVLFGGGNGTANEAWFSGTGSRLNVRFDSQVVRNVHDANGNSIALVDGSTLMMNSDGTMYYNGERTQEDFLGTMKFLQFNGRDGGATGINKISKIRVKS